MEISSLIILFVSNPGSDTQAVKRTLSGGSRRVFYYEDCLLAAAAIRTYSEPYDIIVVDLDMGSECVNTIQTALAESSHNDIPILFLYGETEPETFENAEGTNSYGFVSKGSNAIVLLSSLRLAMKLHSANRQLRLNEQKISESQDRLKRAELVSKSGNWELHLDSGIMVASEGAPKIYGYSLELSKIAFSELQKIPLPEYRPMLNKALSDLVEKDIPYDIEFKIKKADTGEIIDVHSAAEYDKERRVVFGIIRDITKRKKAEEEVEKRNNDLAALLKISQVLGSTLEMEKILQLIVEQSVELLNLHTGAIYLIHGEDLRLAATTPPLPPDFPEIFRITKLKDHPQLFNLISNRSISTIPDTSAVELTPAERQIADVRGLKSIMYLPIIVESRDLGILILSTTDKPHEFTKTEIDLALAFSNQAALAIENAWLFEKVAHELNERRAAEIALRKSEESLSVTLQSIGDGVIATDLQGSIVRMNPMAELLCGWKITEAAGRPLHEVFHIVNAHSRQKVINPVETVLATGKIVALANHTVLIARDGTEYQISDSAAPICNEMGEKLGVVLVFSDVSEKYRKDAELREQEKKYRLLADNSTDMIALHSPGGRCDYVSPASRRMLGYEPEELLGINIFSLIHPEDLAAISLISQKVSVLNNEYMAEYRMKRKNSEYIWLETNYKIIVDPKTQRTENILSVSREITERKKAQEDLLKAKRDAERSDRLKSEFLAQMSHEIRTPISTMLNFISLIREEVQHSLNDEMLFAFGAIDSTSRRIIRTIDLILNMSQVQTGMLECDYKTLDLETEVLKSIIKEHSTAAKLKGLEIFFENKAGNANLRADSYSVIQIFSNLINNAIKYTKEGKIDITIYRTEENNLAVDVSDTGIGISNDYISRLFTPFSQEEQGYTRKFEGNGLGLALVKKYCELNDAEIKVISEKGKGSTFTVIFIRN